jgi:hypothetical protein
LVGAVVLLAACLERPVHTCDEWADCGTDGACEPVAKGCSYADSSCDSGRRFSEFARGSFGGACVERLENAGRGDMCEPGLDACAGLRECVGGRCASVDRLSASAGIVTALCAKSDNDHAPVVLWGESTQFSQIAPSYMDLNLCLLGAGECPDDCIGCTSQECPTYCQGTNAARAVSAGTNHFCIDNGETHCIGANTHFQLGTVAPKLDLLWWVRKHYDLLASGDRHTCGRVPGGVAVDCWGENAQGQLGIAPSPAQPDPVTITPFPTAIGDPLRDINYLASSADFSCAATNNRVACWGDAPRQAGVVDELTNTGSITALDTGADHACAVVDGRVMCWGANDAGQSAPNDPSDVVPPTVVLPDLTFTNLAVGRAHACGVTDTQEVYCWGDDSLDQLGDGVIGPGPVRIDGLPALGPITAGTNFTCAVYADDRLRCWGEVLAFTDRDGVFRRYDDFEICEKRFSDPVDEE